MKEYPDVDIKDLMLRVRCQTEGVDGNIQHWRKLSNGELSLADLDSDIIYMPEQGLLEEKSNYHINEFLVFTDQAFIRAAYRGVMGREPDDTGLADLTRLLRSGHLNKIQVLQYLSESDEGKGQGVVVVGLRGALLRMRLLTLPLLGPVLALFMPRRNILKSQAIAASVEHLQLQQQRDLTIIKAECQRLKTVVEREGLLDD